MGAILSRERPGLAIQRSTPLGILDRIKAVTGATPYPSRNGTAHPESSVEGKGASVVHADFWPHEATRALSELDPIGSRRILAASYVLYAILRHRSLKLCEAPVYVGREDDNGDFEAVDHYLDELFREPNPDQDWQDVATQTQWLIDLDGRALWLRSLDRGNRTRMIDVLHEGEFGVRPDRESRRLYGRFTVSSDLASGEYPPEEVVFFRTPHPYDRYETTSPVDAVASMLGIGGELTTRIKAMVKNAAAPGGFFVRPADAPRMDDEAFAASAARLKQEYNGVRSGGVGLLEGGMTFEEVGWTLKDIEHGALWREVEAAACAAFGVRPEILAFMVGLENAPWSHMETARRLEYEDAHIPMWRTWERTLTRQMLTPEERRAGLQVKFDLSKIPALQEDFDRMSRIAVRLGDDLSINERRVMSGKEPLDGAEYDEVRGRVDPRSGRAREDGTDPTVEDPTIQRGRFRLQAKQALTEEQKSAIWQKFDAFVSAEEAWWEAEVIPVLDADKEWALRWFEDGVKGWYRLEVKEDLGARVRRLMAQLDREYDVHRLPAWQGLSGAMVSRTARAAGRRAAETMGLDWNLMIPGVDRYAERHAAELVTQVTGTTKDRIRSALSRGLQRGEDIPTIAGRIQESGAFSESRATLIARTETTTVANASQVEGLQAYAAATGEEIRKTWIATRDDRTREEHMEMDGVEVQVDAEFNTPDFGLMQGPSAPNCRCTLTYRLVREGEE